MLNTYTARYTKLRRGYVGQLVVWPEVISEGRTLEECRAMVKDALLEMIEAYKEDGREIPPAGVLMEHISVECLRN